MQPTLVIMAAGMGSRYGGIKQLDTMGPNGETIMDYSIFDALHSGFGKIVFVIRKSFMDEFMRVCASRYGNKFPYTFVTQELDDIPAPFTVPEGREKPWGTGQALLATEKEVDGPFGIINADDFYGQNAFKVLATYLSQPVFEDGAYAMVGYMLKKTLTPSGTVSRGVCHRNEEGLLTNVVEHLKIGWTPDGRVMDGDVELGANDLCSMNCWGFTPDVYAKVRSLFVEFLAQRGTEMKSEFLLPTLVNQFIRNGVATCRVLQTDAQWFGVTYREDREGVAARLADLHKQGVYPNPLF